MFAKIKEWIRYEPHWIKGAFLPLLVVASLVIKQRGAFAYIQFLSTVFRLNWPGTFWWVKREINRYFFNSDKNLKAAIHTQFLNEIDVLTRYKKYSDDPALMLDGIITVLAPYSGKSKGVIAIAYSYYFPLFMKFFDVTEIEKRYHIVLEPSWNGLCEETILSFTTLTVPVFVMAYEDRDFDFISQLNTNLVPIRLSANWWISPDQFRDGKPTCDRDIDIIMIAAWAQFKRHKQFFNAIKVLNKQGKKLNITLVGYPNDLNIDDIKALADKAGLLNQLTFYEWISPEEVSNLLGRAKVNVIWSRFEGLNRAIIEGMFCNTPCILRKDFNFGMHYPYINEKTGEFCSEEELPSELLRMIENPDLFSPRDYVVNHHNCYIATEVLGQQIKQTDPSFALESLVPKLSELNGMRYIDEVTSSIFADDYETLRSKIL